MKYGELKWTDVRDGANSKVVVLPVASLEQHGPHMPMLTDTMLAQAVADGIEEELGDQVLTLPVVWVGASHHHLDFVGTISISTDLYSEMLCQILDCLIQAGFRKVFVLNGHGGNNVPGSAALTRTRLKHGHISPLYLAIANYWTMSKEAWNRLGKMETPNLNHACEYETSMMLALRPELVDMDKAEGYGSTLHSDFFDPHEWRPGKGITVAGSFKDVTAIGSMGRPDLATADKGRALLDAAIKTAVAFLREFAGWGKIEQIPNPPIP